MQIIDKLLTAGSVHGRTGKKLVPQGIVVHYVGNPNSTAEANRNYFENGSSGNYVSAHYVIGLKGEIVQCIPDNEVAQHAGKAYGAQWTVQALKNNSEFLGIENCHQDSAGKFNEKTYASLVELVVYLCEKFKLDSKKIYRHYDVTGKRCPLYYVKNQGEWQAFLDLIDAKLQEKNNQEEENGKEEDSEMVTKTNIKIDGKIYEVNRILKDDKNYIELREFEKAGYKVSYDNVSKIPAISK